MAKREKFPTQIFRERYEELEQSEGLTLAEVAARIDWFTTDKKTGEPKPDSSRVGRTIGKVAESGKKRESVTYENAVLLCKALHIDYHDVGV